MWRVLAWGIVALLLSSIAWSPAYGASPTTTGLQISPVRRELKVDPGGTVQASVVVANQTKQDLDITLFFREFSVTNTDYDYSFQISPYNWITISQPELTLVPGQSKTIPFALSPPKDANPGGYYFTIFASSNISSGGVDSTIQAASQLYTTVNGKLDKSSKLDDANVPSLVFSPDITYDFTVTNTGNVYYTIYNVAELSNIFESTSGETAAHTVLPAKPRHLTGTLPAPKLPGIYTASIGYRTDDGSLVTAKKPVVYLPLWSIVVAIGLLFIGYKIIKRIHAHRHAKRTSNQHSDNPTD